MRRGRPFHQAVFIPDNILAFLARHQNVRRSVAVHVDDQDAAIDTAARAAEANGATVTDLELPEILQEAFRAQFVIQDFEAFRSLAFEYDNHREKIGPPLREQLDRAAAISPEEYDAARRTASRARQSLGELMRDIDVILTPSAPGAAPRGFASTGDPVFNRLWTLMGTPCVNVAGLSEGDLPLGVQIFGDFGRDHATLEAALFVERALARNT